MVKVTSIARMHMSSAVALAATLVIVGALLQPVPAGAQCNPTCVDKCEAQLKACKGSAQRQNKQSLAGCTASQKMGNAGCAYMSLILKTVQCLDKCDIELETCKLTGKQGIELCKLNTKAGATACKDSAKQQLQQALADCENADIACLSLCP